MGPPRVLQFSAAAGSLAAKFAPLSIIGQPHDLKLYSHRLYDLYQLKPKISEDLWNEAIAKAADGTTVPVYLNKVIVSALNCRPARYNCPFGSHELNRLVKSDCASTTKSGESVLTILCEPPAILSYVAAIARVFPTFSCKTSQPKSNSSTPGALHVEFLIVPERRFSDPNNTQWRSLTEEEASFCSDVAHGVRLTQRLVDTPPDMMNVSHFLDECKNVLEDVTAATGAVKVSADVEQPNVGNKASMSLKIIRGDELKRLGLGGIINVGRQAEDPPALAILTYKPSAVQGAAGALAGGSSPIAWVGKGILYDTGGLALKSRASMAGMKRDMGGAAACLGAFYVAAKRGFNQVLHGVFCLAENSIGPKALRIDDIITMYSGKTIEVTNPDAEGRLVVADGVAYSRNVLKCGTIVDLCTLTGAQATTTGKIHAGIMSNDQELEHATVICGRFSGDLTFPMIYAPELLVNEFSSAVADYKNSVSDRSVPLSSCAGHFIEAVGGLLPADNPPGSSPLPRWLHIDLAAPVHSGERATGYGVALLNALFGGYSCDPLLKCVAPPQSQEHAGVMAQAAVMRQNQGDVEMVSHTPEPAAAD